MRLFKKIESKQNLRKPNKYKNKKNSVNKNINGFKKKEKGRLKKKIKAVLKVNGIN
jgi:hypothetical protein